jgi:glycosyltransferase involved in cell wall biosynthesis
MRARSGFRHHRSRIGRGYRDVQCDLHVRTPTLGQVQRLKTLSVLTPVYEPLAEHLTAAYQSLAAQRMPPEWDWEWIVQEDGDTGIAREILPADPRITFGEGRKLGVAHTRNLGVSRVRGSLVKTFDQDDVLTEDVLLRDIQVLESRPEIDWTTSRVLDLMPDGSTVGFDGDPSAGRIEPGVVHSLWRERNFRSPVHPTTLCIRLPLLEALGGWMALPGSDDTGLLIAASVVSAGYFHPEVGLLYRKWPGQVTASPSHTEPVEWALRMNLIDRRARAISQMLAEGCG